MNRFYYFFIRSYENLDTILTSLNNNPHTSRYALIYHDKDGNEPHYHILLRLSNNQTFSAFCKEWIVFSRSHIEVCRSPLLAFEYLIHLNHPDKYQYNKLDIISNDLAFFNGLSDDDKTQITLDLIDDILNGLSEKEMLQKYGRDYIINYEKYHSFAFRLKWQENPHQPITDPTTGEVLTEQDIYQQLRFSPLGIFRP